MARQRKARLLPLAVSTQQCAEMLGVNPRTILEAIKRCELPCYESTIGAPRRRILSRDIETWVTLHWRRV